MCRLRQVMACAALAVYGGRTLAAAPEDVIQNATQEQWRSGNCALTGMPRAARESLLAATRRYFQDRDTIRLAAAFQIDEVPETLARCFEFHATLTRAVRWSEADFQHFYDQAERSLRLWLVIDVSREKNATAEAIKNVTAGALKQLEQRNREYY